MITDGVLRMNEATLKKLYGVKHWVHDLPFLAAEERLVSQPTVNIEGLVGGYTGPGGKTILPHRAAAKLDLRLVPNMTAASALDALKKHLAKRGFGDIEVNMTGGYDPNTTPADSSLNRAMQSVYRKNGIWTIFRPRPAAPGPGTCLRVIPSSFPRAISEQAMARERMHRTSITWSSHPIRKSKAWTARRFRTCSSSTSWPRPREAKHRLAAQQRASWALGSQSARIEHHFSIDDHVLDALRISQRLFVRREIPDFGRVEYRHIGGHPWP